MELRALVISDAKGACLQLLVLTRKGISLGTVWTSSCMDFEALDSWRMKTYLMSPRIRS